MGLKVIWSDRALKDLEEIYDYYCFEATNKIAKTIIKKIVNSIDNIKHAPNLGKIDKDLSQGKSEFRFVIKEKYKIYYAIDMNYIKIMTVFDVLRNPEELRKRIN